MITMLRSGMTRVISPCLPMSLPDRTSTRSPFLRRIFTRSVISEHLRSERHDPHEPAVPKLSSHRAEDAGTAWLHLVVDQHRCVLIEADVAAVSPPTFLLRPHDDALDNFTLLHCRAGHRVFDSRDEHVADPGVAPSRASEHLDAQDLAGTRVVGHLEAGFLLDHRARSSTSTTRHRFWREIGRVSARRTRSPSRASLASSCA